MNRCHGRCDYRFLPVLLLVLTSVLVFAAETNGPPDSPTSSLRPPRGEISPSFWEQNGAWVVLAAVVTVAMVALAIWFIARPKPVAPIPFSVLAKKELEPLRQLPENGALLSRASQIVRHYVTAMFSLPPGEHTTAEFCEAVRGESRIGAELARDICEFMTDCDVRKFSPSAPAFPSGTVARAFTIIDRAESRLAELTRPSTQPPGSRPPPLPSQAKGVPSGA